MIHWIKFKQAVCSFLSTAKLKKSKNIFMVLKSSKTSHWCSKVWQWMCCQKLIEGKKKIDCGAKVVNLIVNSAYLIYNKPRNQVCRGIINDSKNLRHIELRFCRQTKWILPTDLMKENINKWSTWKHRNRGTIIPK